MRYGEFGRFSILTGNPKITIPVNPKNINTNIASFLLNDIDSGSVSVSADSGSL